VGIEDEELDVEPAFVPANAWEAWMVQAVKSVVRARLISKAMRWVAVGAAGLGVLGVGAVYWYLFTQTDDFSDSTFDKFLQGSITAAGIGIAACTSVAVLLGGSALVEIYAQRLDLAIIEADDEGDIE